MRGSISTACRTARAVRGRKAVRRLLAEDHRAGIIPHPVNVEFVE